MVLGGHFSEGPFADTVVAIGSWQARTSGGCIGIGDRLKRQVGD